jgi:hypothetical protein
MNCRYRNGLHVCNQVQGLTNDRAALSLVVRQPVDKAPKGESSPSE